MSRMYEEKKCRTICPPDFRAFWNARADRAADCAMEMQPVALHSPAAEYYELHLTAEDGAVLYARYICPVGEKKVPTVLMFHDHGRGIRGWHHMTRFVALGYAVVALENRFIQIDVTADAEAGPDGIAAVKMVSDALTMAQAARKLPCTDCARLITWGEGLGAGLAIDVAAMIPGVVKCAALNPVPADFRTAWEQNCNESIYAGVISYFRNHDPKHTQEEQLFSTLDYLDCVNFASMLKSELLLGTSEMDTTAPPDTQDAVFRCASGEKRQIRYPKYIHERINFYENELLKFLHF